ncbi:WGR domain-containing protein [Martelella mediterranea]|uniref:WGR domain protein n=1 Tax=Martelella mediterranea DSM 17316 TaxID=1122214 RepID=A0A1U9Z9D1_9HYPH|nr:WGR domain-containing protein [Martelella mediterranea]AQZ54284.1 WGR domain protein [Martelella mediterranea DSM 17316]|tara:strand:+ start:619 stop:870 length:252 start_codon:yes stop_codon:yes gene_type:complete
MSAQFDLFPTDVLLRRIEPATNKWRFYHLSIEGGLFGDWCLVRRWGRIGTSGQLKLDWFTSAGQAHDALGVLEQSKRKRGYRD